jgi:acyl-coenzyme A thioesterase PaaI-like protein
MTAVPYVAPDPDYAQRIRASFGRQGAMKLIESEITDVAPGYCAFALEPHPGILQQHGYVHAGIVMHGKPEYC